MRMNRELLLAPNHDEDGGIYHVISRVVWREFVLGDEEREYFKGLICRYAAFCGIEVLSYCIVNGGDRPAMRKGKQSYIL